MRIFPVIALRSASLLFAPALLWAAPAYAQEQDHVVVGAGVAVVPVVEGSRHYRALPLPAIDIKEGWLFANLRNGVGVTPLDTDHVTIGVSAMYIRGYRRHDVPAGVDKLSDGVGGRAFANVREGGFLATLGVVKGVAGQTKGVIADASIAYPFRVTARLTLTPMVGTTWADGKYNNRYFGIDAVESDASGLRRFTPGSGFKDVTGAITARYRLTERITASATAGIVTIVGDVQDSPLVQSRTRHTGLLSLSYRL